MNLYYIYSQVLLTPPLNLTLLPSPLNLTRDVSDISTLVNFFNYKEGEGPLTAWDRLLRAQNLENIILFTNLLGLKRIRWFHSDNYLYDDIIEEFMRIFKENASSLKHLEIDYALLNFVPFFLLQLESLTIPNFGGGLDDVSFF